MGSYRSEHRTDSLESAVSSALSEIESLKDEMDEIKSNMENANMEHLPKYETASEAYDALDSAQEPDVPEAVGELSVEYNEEVNKRKGRGPSRAVRLSNAVAQLQACVAALEYYESARQDIADNEDAETVDQEVAQSEIDEASELRDELETIINDVENVEFPGMYG